jgi:signal transduction histidine kinase
MTLDHLFNTRERQFLLLQLVGWTGWLILFWLRDLYYQGLGDHGMHFLILLIDAGSGFILTYFLRYIYQAVWEKSLATRIATIIVASYAVAAVWQPFKNYILWNYWESGADLEKMLSTYGYWAYFFGIIQLSYFLLIGWSGLYFGIKYYQLLLEEREKSLKSASMAHEAQLRMLRYQLNPHFLFNTLNAISTLILEAENKTANSMVQKLSAFLRYSLDNDPMEKIDLEHEVDSIKLYLEIEKVRFEDRLAVEYDIDDLSMRALVPSLLLQPLVENSIKYAVAASENGGVIRIKSRVFAQELLLEISDNGPGIDMSDGKVFESRGVGINNTRERLNELYGRDHSCKFGNAEPSGLKISIRIPYETK